MKKVSFILFIYCAPFLFSNFGLVEYSVLHPKSKTVQADSVQRQQKLANLYQASEAKNESAQDEERNSESNPASWSQYIVLGFKAIVGFFIQILAHF
jgi:hypothetical protein